MADKAAIVAVAKTAQKAGNFTQALFLLAIARKMK